MAAAHLAQNVTEGILIFSGGVPSGPRAQSEAEAMREHATRCHGLDGVRRVLLEDLSRSTRENALFTLKVLSAAEFDVQSLTVVTNLFHVRRACATFTRAARDSGLHLCVRCPMLPPSTTTLAQCKHAEVNAKWNLDQQPNALRLELGFLLLREPLAHALYWSRGWL